MLNDIRIKIHYGETIRRFSINKNLSFSQFDNLVKNKFKLNKNCKLQYKYVDNEKDEICCDSEMEWNEAKNCNVELLHIKVNHQPQSVNQEKQNTSTRAQQEAFQSVNAQVSSPDGNAHKSERLTICDLKQLEVIQDICKFVDEAEANVKKIPLIEDKEKKEFEIRKYDELLTQKLLTLDAIQGGDYVRKCRKGMIIRIQKVLSSLDKIKAIN